MPGAGHVPECVLARARPGAAGRPSSVATRRRALDIEQLDFDARERAADPKNWSALPAVAARELVHDINKRVEASVRVGARFGEFAEAPVGLLAKRSEVPVGFLDAPVSFFAMASKRHRHVHQLANHARIRLNQPHRVGLPVFEQLDVRGKLRLLLNDEIHPRFDVVGHGGIIA